MDRTRFLRLSTLVAGALLVAGGTIAYWTSARAVVTEYRIFVGAEAGTNWTLWVPSPEISLPVPNTKGTVRVVGPVATERGAMMNLTGQGEAAINFTLARIVLSVGGFSQEGRVNLSAGDGRGAYWVWRQAGDPVARMWMEGHAWWTGERLGERFRCGGSIAWFDGDAAEGWTLVPEQWTDCVGVVQPPLWDAAAAVLLGLGGTMAVGAVWVWTPSRRRR